MLPRMCPVTYSPQGSLLTDGSLQSYGLVTLTAAISQITQVMISPGKKSQAKVRAPCPVIRVMAALLAAWFNLPPKLEQWKYSRTPSANNGKILHNGDFLMRTVYWLLLCEEKNCQSISFWIMHFWPFFSLILNTKENALRQPLPQF